MKSNRHSGVFLNAERCSLPVFLLGQPSMSLISLSSTASPQSTIAPPTGLTVAQCATINFGKVSLNPDQTQALSLMNRQIIELCRSLPAPLRDSGLLAIQQHFTGFQLANLTNFFTKFYVPSWSLIYWMQQANPMLSEAELEQAICAQGLAYFLHMLDDHISDGQIPISHLLLQLRTHAWTTFTRMAQQLAQPLSEGDTIIQTTLDRYFTGIHNPSEVAGSEAYAGLFRQQLSTTLVIPLLVAHRTGCQVAPLQQAYEEFCIAWRLLDDLRDCAEDTFAGQKSGIYHLLTPEYQVLWAACRGLDETAESWLILRDYLEQSGVLQTLIEQTIDRLDQAQIAAIDCGLTDYAQEMIALSVPLTEAIG
jgi:hypothetical protein